MWRRSTWLEWHNPSVSYYLFCDLVAMNSARRSGDCMLAESRGHECSIGRYVYYIDIDIDIIWTRIELN